MRLLVFSHVEVDFSARTVCNLGFKQIILNYLKFWDEVILVGPTKHHKSFVISSDVPGLTLVGLKGTNRSLLDKASHYLIGAIRKYKFLINHGILKDVSLIQFRYPSIYTYSLARHIVSKRQNVVFYIAADGVEAVRYNYPYLTWAAKLLEMMEIATLKGQKVVTTGPVLARKYSKYSQTHAYFSTTHNKVEKRKPRESFSNFIYVGTLEKRKRVIDLIRAIHILYNDGHDIQCRIVGEGSTRPSLERFVVANDLSSIISFEGYVSDTEQLEQFYLEADFLVLPSLAEGTPRVLPEAMSFGVIPFASKGVASNDYIIKEGHNGFLFQPKNPQAIANKISMVLQDRALYVHCLNGVFQYASQHTIDKELAKMWKFYLNNKQVL